MSLLTALPHLNAVLNAASALLLCAGYRAIRRGDRQAHRRRMIAAFTVSVAFLASYVTYHAIVGTSRFQGEGWIRPVYFSILLSHTLLAAAAAPLAVIALGLALKQRFSAHRRLARWTLPVWLYVSVTGVAVYLLLYHW
jgi:uncharacterized membrane protein YozB (DUF420 family)